MSAIERREPVDISDLREEPLTPIHSAILRAGYRAVLAAPLMRPSQIVGLLVVRRREPGQFSKGNDRSHQDLRYAIRTGDPECIYAEPPERMREVIERVQANGRPLLGLINDVLDLTKIEAGQLALSLADYSLNDVVGSVILALESLAIEKGLSFKAELPAHLPTGEADANGSFTVAVCDSGPGIRPADQARIFDEFQQADSSITRSKGPGSACGSPSGSSKCITGGFGWNQRWAKDRRSSSLFLSGVISR